MQTMVVKTEDEGDDIVDEQSELFTYAEADQATNSFGPCDVVVFLPKLKVRKF